MKPHAQDLPYSEGVRLVSDDVRQLHALLGEPATELGDPSNANAKIGLAVLEMLKSEQSLGRGVFLCRILHLPPKWKNALMEYVAQVGPYARYHFDLTITLRNCGSQPIDVLLGTIPIPEINLDTGEESRNVGYDTEGPDVRATLQPGDERELDVRWAVRNMLEKSYQAMSPLHQRNPAGGVALALATRSLREVAYSATYSPIPESGVSMANSGKGRVDSNAWQLAQVEAAVRAAGNMSDAADAVARLEAVEPWWPRPDEYDPLLAKLTAKLTAKLEKKAGR